MHRVYGGPGSARPGARRAAAAAAALARAGGSKPKAAGSKAAAAAAAAGHDAGTDAAGSLDYTPEELNPYFVSRMLTSAAQNEAMLFFDQRPVTADSSTIGRPVAAASSSIRRRSKSGDV